MMSDVAPPSGPLLKVEGLCVEFRRAAGFARRRFPALQDVSFEIAPGETVGLVGESGAGKSTLARAILRLVPAMRGRVIWRGRDLLSLDARALRAQRRDLQIIFQDPLASLDPRMSVADILSEPLEIHESGLDRAARQMRIAAMLQQVGLDPRLQERRPHEFSGGQCQRIGIARAMMTGPRLLICDEPVGSLDVSIRGQIVNLLSDLQRDAGLSVLFISHDLAVVRHISQRVLVMYLGRLVETGARDALFAAPRHPYTQELLTAVAAPVPVAIPGALSAGVAGDAPAEAPPPQTAGCAYRNRCRAAREICARSEPRLEEASPGHFVACLRWRELAS